MRDIACRRIPATNHGDLRIGKHHPKPGTPQSGVNHRIRCRVRTRDAALVRGFVQQRHIVVGVTRDENAGNATAHRDSVEQRHPSGVEFGCRVLESQSAHIGRTTGRREQKLEMLHLRTAIERPILNCHAIAVARDIGMCIGVKVELVTKRAPRIFEQYGIGQRPQPASAPEYLDAHPQSMQCLTQFETDDAGTEHRDAFRKIIPFENFVVGDESIAQRLPCRRECRRRASGNHDPRRRDRDPLVHLQRGVINEARMAADTFRLRNVLDAAQDEADKTIALALDPRHHGTTVDLDLAVELQAETGKPVDRVRRFCRRNQQFARHATHARAGGAVGTAFNQQHPLACGLRRAPGGEACRAGADHGDIGHEILHRRCLNAGHHRTPLHGTQKPPEAGFRQS